MLVGHSECHSLGKLPECALLLPSTPAPEFVCVFRGLLIRWTLGGKSPPVVVKGT